MKLSAGMSEASFLFLMLTLFQEVCNSTHLGMARDFIQ